MDLSALKAPKRAAKRRKRVGRGPASGHGKTSGHGNKGANARAGATTHIGFEGGQMPLIRRIPKRGFTSENKTFYQIINVEKLNAFKNNSIVDAESFLKLRLIRKRRKPIKVLGDGELKKPLTVRANVFSESAKKKIIEAGGKIEIVPNLH